MSWRVIALAAATMILGTGAAQVSAEPIAHINSLRVSANGIAADISIAGLAGGVIAPEVSAAVGGRPVPATAQLVDTAAEQVFAPQSLVLAIDVSGSMASGSLYAAKLATLQFIDELPTDVRIGLVAFGDTSTIVSRLTTDRPALRSAITRLRPSGDTALYDGSSMALDLLGTSGRRNLILLTDGQDTSSTNTAAAVVRAVRASGIRVDAIQFNSERGNDGFLRDIVAAGLGQEFAARDAETLLEVFRQTTQTQVAQVSVLLTDLPREVSGRQPITIDLQFGAQRTLVVGSVDLPVVGDSGRQSPFVTPLLLALSLVLAASIFTLLLALLAGSKRARRRRIEQVIAIRNEMLGLEAEAGADDATLIESLEELVRPWIRRSGVEQKWTLMLDGAGLLLTAEQWLLIRIAAVLVPMLTMAGLFPSSLSLIGISALAGYFAPPFLVGQRRKARGRDFEAALPDMLLLIASSLRSGFSLEQAIVTAAEQSDGPAAQQMKRAMQELRIGLPLEVTLGRVAERMASRDFDWVVSALQIQRKSGGNLSELLSTAAKTVRERAEIRREVLTLTAEGRLSANVMMVMPFGLLGFMLVSQPGYVEPLWATEMGRLFSMIAAIMLTLGWFAMRKLTQVEA